jgi:hypothetical protein
LTFIANQAYHQIRRGMFTPKTIFFLQFWPFFHVFSSHRRPIFWGVCWNVFSWSRNIHVKLLRYLESTQKILFGNIYFIGVFVPRTWDIWPQTSWIFSKFPMSNLASIWKISFDLDKNSNFIYSIQKVEQKSYLELSLVFFEHQNSMCWLTLNYHSCPFQGGKMLLFASYLRIETKTRILSMIFEKYNKNPL